ncbi:Tar DNA-binding protein homolog 1 [Caenorhabditis elegans]|uniref:Isoform a of Tar DNA-binding protein homolog 1 n=1 Tax=Caenorhabditis elegans TaxID=6239 RepID=D0VWM8-2|nr:Tar DNA-binding protein homolog 1 [Caenorhabditis elegans]CAA90120.1 Tar DNA-binding protein homolog 1 [Caenorhabditis elegans]|eukprot:NP_001022166.1 Tar DNA-binding protein homolog 1 [Caenorhabditis elegans]
MADETPKVKTEPAAEVKSPLDEVKEIRKEAELTQTGSDEKKTTDPEFITVQDPNGDEPIELPTVDGVVLMTTLQASFPGATGLKYKNPKTGANRAVQVDPSGLKLIAPADGWENKTFFVIVAPQSERVRALSSADATSAKRRKVGSSDDSDSDDGRDGRSGRKRAVERDSQPVDLIVLGVDFKTTDECFQKYFEDIGTVVFCEIKRKSDGNSKGFGFVRMSSVGEQNKVLAIPQHMIDGRRCDVKVPDGRDKQGRPSISRIFVGRLTDKVDEHQLRKVFGDEAKSYIETAVVTDVFIPKPFRGFAFVTLSSAEAAERIVSKGSLTVNGLSVGLSIAQPREENNQSVGPDYGLPAGYRNRRERDRPDRRPIQNEAPLPMPFVRPPQDYSYRQQNSPLERRYWAPGDSRGPGW